MRVTCKRFAFLPTLLMVLFYDFNIYATCRSMDNLYSLSQHHVLREYVHRLVFCRPVFQSWRAEFYRRNPHLAKWVNGDRTTRKEMESSMNAYKAAFDEQERLLSSGTYMQEIRRCISQFPKLSSVFISDMISLAFSPDSPSDMPGLSLLQKHYPDILLFKDGKANDGKAKDGKAKDNKVSANDHIATVFEVVAVARVQLKELVTCNGWGPSWSFSWEKIPETLKALDFSELSRLDLSLRNDNRFGPGLPDWSAALCPLLNKMPALTELYLRLTLGGEGYETLDEVWDLDLPALTLLAVEGFQLPGGEFCNFIRRHVHVRELTLWRITIGARQYANLFHTVREHPVLKDFEIVHTDDERIGRGISTFRQNYLNDDDCERQPTVDETELYAYVHKQGNWTSRLAQKWGEL